MEGERFGADGVIGLYKMGIELVLLMLGMLEKLRSGLNDSPEVVS